jgi:hypothetical protein
MICRPPQFIVTVLSVSGTGHLVRPCLVSGLLYAKTIGLGNALIEDGDIFHSQIICCTAELLSCNINKIK